MEGLSWGYRQSSARWKRRAEWREAEWAEEPRDKEGGTSCTWAALVWLMGCCFILFIYFIFFLFGLSPFFLFAAMLMLASWFNWLLAQNLANHFFLVCFFCLSMELAQSYRQTHLLFSTYFALNLFCIFHLCLRGAVLVFLVSCVEQLKESFSPPFRFYFFLFYSGLCDYLT